MEVDAGKVIDHLLEQIKFLSKENAMLKAQLQTMQQAENTDKE